MTLLRNTMATARHTRVVATCALLAAGTGCAYRQVDATCANVPNPVLLGPVDRVRGHHAPENAPKVAEVDEEVAEALTTSSHQEGDYDVTTTSHTREGANKISFAVVDATQGQKTEDVRVTDLHAGAWVFFPLAAVKNKFWVGVEGDAVKVVQ